jgi:hypothetical protein
VQRDPIETERDANRLDVLGVIARGVELSTGPDDGGAVARKRGALFGRCEVRGLQRRAVQQSRLPRAAVVERDERVARHHVAQALDVGLRTEAERARRALAGTSGDEEHDASWRPLGRQNLDVERDRAGHAPAAIEGHVDPAALNLRCAWTRRQGDRRVGAARHEQDHGDCKNEQEATTHEARQGSSGRVPSLVPGIR